MRRVLYLPQCVLLVLTRAGSTSSPCNRTRLSPGRALLSSNVGRGMRKVKSMASKIERRNNDGRGKTTGSRAGGGRQNIIGFDKSNELMNTTKFTSARYWSQLHRLDALDASVLVPTSDDFLDSLGQMRTTNSTQTNTSQTKRKVAVLITGILRFRDEKHVRSVVSALEGTKKHSIV